MKEELPTPPFKTRNSTKTILPDRLGHAWKRLHLLWKILTTIGILAILGIPFYGSVIKANTTRSYQSDLAAAKQALSERRWVEARDLSLEVLRNYPKETDALPVFMHAADGAEDSRLAGIAQAYLSLNTRVKAERVYAWKAICSQSPMGIAGKTWFLIPESEQTDPDFLMPWLERLIVEGLTKEAESALAKQTTFTDPRLERIRLSMLAKRATEVSFRELQARLIDHIAKCPSDGPLMLEAVDEIPQTALIPYFFTAMGEWIKAHKGEPTLENQLRLARCEIAAYPESAEAVLTRIRSSFAVSHPLAVAGLYAALHRFDQAEELLKPLVPKGDVGVFDLMAELLENQGKLDEWDRLLESPPEGVFLPSVFCDRAFIAGKRGEERARTQFEQEALAIAGKRLKSDSLIQLARHASGRKMTFALEVWVKTIRRGPASPLPFFTSISPVFETAARDQQESQLLEMLTLYKSLEPGNVDLITQHLYLACLVGNVTPAQLLEGLSPVREKIHSHALDCTVALGHLLEGRYDLAAQLTSDKNIDWFAQVPALRAIRAIALTKTGRKEEADIYLEDFPWDSMLPSETRVFRELLELPGESEEVKEAHKLEKTERARIAELARQEKKAKEIKEIREKLSAKDDEKNEETKKAERAERAERAEQARLAEEARQVKRAQELKEARERLAARAAKDAEDLKKAGKIKPVPSQ